MPLQHRPSLTASFVTSTPPASQQKRPSLPTATARHSLQCTTFEAPISEVINRRAAGVPNMDGPNASRQQRYHSRCCCTQHDSARKQYGILSGLSRDPSATSTSWAGTPNQNLFYSFTRDLRVNVWEQNLSALLDIERKLISSTCTPSSGRYRSSPSRPRALPSTL